MKTGCPECEKLPDDKLCDWCELGMLQCTAEAAIRDYIDKVNEMNFHVKKGKQDGHSKNQRS